MAGFAGAGMSIEQEKDISGHYEYVILLALGYNTNDWRFTLTALVSYYKLNSSI